MILPIVAFLVVSLLIGIYSSRRIKGSVRNYFVAGNVIPFWVLVFSMSGQAIELGGTHDNANLAMSTGFWDGAVLPIGIGISLVLIGLFFARPLHKLRLLTLSDYYVYRYGKVTGGLVGLICVFSFIILIAGNLAGLGMLLQVSIDVSPLVSVPAVALLVLVYTIAGGLFAVTWNDVLQIGVSIVGFAVAFLWVMTHFDSEIIHKAIDFRFSWAPLTELDHGSLRVWASLLALGLGDIVALDFMERVFAAGTARGAQAACIVSGIVTILVGVVLAFIGMVVSVVPSAISGAPYGSILDFINHEFPPGIKMLTILGFLGAGISTIDGAIMACAVVLSRNVVAAAAPTLVPAHRLLFLSRMMAIPVTVLAVLLAIVFPVPGELLVLAFDVVFSGCLIPLALGIYWSRGTARAAFLAIVLPSILRVVLHFFFTDMVIANQWDGIQTLAPPVLSLLIFFLVSIFDSPPGEVSKELA